MAIVLSEGRHAGEFVMSEANFHRSRDNIVIVSGSGKLVPGTVLGKITATGKYAPSPDTGATGVQVGAAVLLYAVDATSADAAVSAITRDAEINGKTLTYEATVNDGTKQAAKNAQLAAVGIIVR